MTRTPRHLPAWSALPAWLWLATAVLLPLVIILAISVAEPRLAAPPFTPLWQDGRLQVHLQAYTLLAGDPLYRAALGNSLRLAALATGFCLLIAFPMALAMTRAPHRWRSALLLLVVLPFWTSFLIRVYAWIGLLKEHGLVNQVLLALGVIREPLALLYTETAVLIGIVYAYLPFMVLPLYAVLVRLDPALLEAAADLGCQPWTVFRRVTLPLAMPGVIAGTLLVFIPAAGEFVIPDLLGGTNTLMVGKLVWTEFFANRDWPTATALAVVLLVVLCLPMVILQRAEDRLAAAERTRG